MDEGNWGVLGLSRDPVPGDPVAVRALATYSQGEARYWQGHEQTLRTTAERGRAMRMEGEFAAPYRERLAQLPANATALRSAHQNAETALAQYAQQLEQAKTEARTALRQGSQAKESYNQAMRAREQAIAEMNALPKVVPPEQYPYVLQQWEYLQGQANRAQMFAEQAEQEWNQARQLAIQAGEQANAAEASCAQRIQAATPGTTNTTSSNQAPQPLTAGSERLGGEDAIPDAAEGTAAGWKPGDPIPGPLTGNRLPADAKLGNGFRYENDPEKWTTSGLPGRVKYMSEQEREASRVFVDGAGRMRMAKDGSLLDTSGAISHWSQGGGRAIFVMDRSGNIYLSMEQKVGYLHHSSFLGGRNVVGAGELEVIDGRLVLITNQSGHYLPTPEMNARVLESLRERGVILDPTFHILSMG